MPLDWRNIDKNIKYGRPQKNFNELGECSKRLRTAELRASYSSEEIVYAAQMYLKAEGKMEAANMLRHRNEVCKFHFSLRI